MRIIQKKYVFGLILLCITIVIACIIALVSKREIELRTDREPIENRFPDLPSFTDCYWKTNIIGTKSFGPSNYWIKGFIVLDEEDAVELRENYVWEIANIEFSKEINPEILNINAKNWYYSDAFSKSLIRQRFIGNFYFESEAKILYFEVENN